MRQPELPSGGPAAATDPPVVQGAVHRVTFTNEETGFTVARVLAEGPAGGGVTIVGVLPSLAEGEWVRCEGSWETSPRFGRQFKVTTCLPATPKTAAGIERYLGSKRVKGVGPELARRIVSHFGAETLRVLESQPERLREVEGIGRKRQQQLVDGWKAHAAERAVLVFLHGLGIGAAHARRIYRAYGDDTSRRLTENPYCLSADIWGIGFATADRVARSVGVPVDAPARADAGLRHVLERAAEEGHVCVAREELVARAAELLGVTSEAIEAAVSRLVEAGTVREELMPPGVADPRPWVYLHNLHAAERGVAARLIELADAPRGFPSIKREVAIDWVEKRRGLALAPSQREALRLVLEAKVSVITGGPGVGKTTIVASLLDIVRAKRVRVRLAAPTGRAAKRMQEATGCEAMTVHRLLRWNPRLRDFDHHADNPVPDCDLLVLDEASMLDVVLTHRLLAALPTRAHLVIVGDRDQLPSVGPGSVLGDIAVSGAVPVARLTEVHRQASGSSIIAGAHAVHRGEKPQLRRPGTGSDLEAVEVGTPEEALEAVVALVTRDLPQRLGLDPVRDIQVLAPMHRGGCGVQALNARLAEVLGARGEAPSVVRGGRRYALGAKVIQLKNDYDREVYNGDIGVVTAVHTDDEALEVDVDGRTVRYGFGDLDELDLAYAVSIHKSQGSEYPCVVVPVLTQHYMMLRRNLLYTAITRGRRHVVLVGQDRALGIAARTDDTRERGSFLAARLRSCVR
jgi:exodeoxyribonuclease V alpha subunit